jgi:hypothetical protein
MKITYFCLEWVCAWRLFLTKTTSVQCKHSNSYHLDLFLACCVSCYTPLLFISFCFEYTHLIFELNMFVNFLKPRQNYLGRNNANFQCMCSIAPRITYNGAKLDSKLTQLLRELNVLRTKYY